MKNNIFVIYLKPCSACGRVFTKKARQRGGSLVSVSRFHASPATNIGSRAARARGGIPTALSRSSVHSICPGSDMVRHPWRARCVICWSERSIRHQFQRQSVGALSHQKYMEMHSSRFLLVGGEPRVRTCAPHFNLAGDGTRRYRAPCKDTDAAGLQGDSAEIRVVACSCAPYVKHGARGRSSERQAVFSSSDEDGQSPSWRAAS